MLTLPTWVYNSKPITNLNDFPKDTFGFIYIVKNTNTNKSYIGKKVFYHTQNKKLGKKEIAALPTQRGHVPSKKKIVKESDWKTYYGSADEVKQWAKTTPKDKLLRVVMRLCKSSKELTYYETKYMFDYNVLEDQNKWANSNILGKFFPKDLSL